MHSVDLDGDTVGCCSECGAFCRSMHLVVGEGVRKFLCDDCLAKEEGVTPPSEAVVVPVGIVREVAAARDGGARYSGWYVYGRREESGGTVRTIVTDALAWSHDVFGRPEFSVESFEDAVRLRRDSRLLGTLFTVPAYSEPLSESNRWPLKLTRTDLVLICDWGMRRGTAIRRSGGDGWTVALALMDR